ncbi:anti-sigma factor antagonist [Mycobacterium sp. PS03-16]|uniref:STAS domain-containing protein n=1 Tax=Mycobacterium sp. PS03-16 TaxID=2559611 RepID=UPI001073365F|nr:STAS domain-containing protein [Mycobacterium sp. PS03-16]TFV61575.1 anti-sigma factor antagonist [Mycobacterium sp. PS03-16]
MPSIDHLTFSTEWLDPYEVRLTVSGSIDAANAADLAAYVFRRGANSRRLVLDMTGVDFLSTAGFSILCTIGERCVRAGVDWELVSNPTVRRVVEICDPHRTLPLAAA